MASPKRRALCSATCRPPTWRSPSTTRARCSRRPPISTSRPSARDRRDLRAHLGARRRAPAPATSPADAIGSQSLSPRSSPGSPSERWRWPSSTARERRQFGRPIGSYQGVSHAALRRRSPPRISLAHLLRLLDRGRGAAVAAAGRRHGRCSPLRPTPVGAAPRSRSSVASASPGARPSVQARPRRRPHARHTARPPERVAELSGLAPASQPRSRRPGAGSPRSAFWSPSLALRSPSRKPSRRAPPGASSPAPGAGSSPSMASTRLNKLARRAMRRTARVRRPRFLAQNGFYAIRLGIIWKALEPQPGVYDDVISTGFSAPTGCSTSRGIAVPTASTSNQRFQERGAPDRAIVGQAATENPSPQLGFPFTIAQNAVNHAYDAFWANTQVPQAGESRTTPRGPTLSSASAAGRLQPLQRACMGTALQQWRTFRAGTTPDACGSAVRGT